MGRRQRNWEHEQVVLLFVLLLLLRSFSSFVGNLSAFMSIVDSNENILKHIASQFFRTIIFRRFFRLSFSLYFIGRLKSKHRQRTEEYHTGSLESADRAEERESKLVSLNAFFFDGSSEESVSRRHKLIRSWLQTWTLWMLLAYGLGSVIVLKTVLVRPSRS